MDAPLPFDAYVALGVSKSATGAEIKSAYRKLVLTTHPDKFPDPAIKKRKEDEFHRIQQAYEKIGDEDERKKYDAEVRLHAKFAEVQNLRASSSGSGGTSSRPGPTRRAATFAEFSGQSAYAATPSGGVNYEFRTPKFDDYDDYDIAGSSSRSQKRSSPAHPRAEKVRASVRSGTTSAERRARREGDKRRDEDQKRDREYKYASARQEDDRAKFEEDRRRRDLAEKTRRAEERVKEDRRREEERRRDEARREEVRREELRREEARREEARREEARREEARREEARREESRREELLRESRKVKKSSPVDPYYEKVAEKESLARAHISRMSGHRSSDDDRPRVERSSSSRDQYQVRRSRAKAKDSGRSSDRKGSTDRDRKPSLQSEMSAPPRISTRIDPKRTYSIPTDYDQHRHESEPRPGVIPRINTEPVLVSSPRREKTSSSRLRDDSGYSSPGTPEAAFVPPPLTSSKTYYAVTPDGAKLVDPASLKYNTVTREPDRYRDRSPERMSSSREVPRYTTSSSRFPPGPTYSYPDPRASVATAESRRPSLRESSSLSGARRERSRERRSHEEYRRSPRTYPEVVPDYSVPSSTYKYQIPPEKVSYASPIKDVHVSPAYSPYEKDGRDQYFEPKPHMYRSQTTYA